MGDLQKKTLGYHEIINTIQLFEDLLKTPHLYLKCPELLFLRTYKFKKLT
jgi:hypothetical protein